jgi:hypothetical protein
MGDNINIKDSSNAVVPVATEDIGGGVEVQRVKLMLGAHGQDGGDVTDPNPLPVEIQNTTDTDSPVWGTQGPLTQDAREQSNYDSVNPLLTRDTHLGRVLGQDLLVNPSTKRLQVEGAPVADNSVFGFLPALNTDLTVVLSGIVVGGKAAAGSIGFVVSGAPVVPDAAGCVGPVRVQFRHGRERDVRLRHRRIQIKETGNARRNSRRSNAVV